MAADFASDYGLRPDPWQALVLEDWLSVSDGRWSSLTCGLAVPRQNGKNAVVEMRELFGMVGRGEKFAHTAHEVKTARKAFKRLLYFFGSQRNDPAAHFPELNALVTEVRNVNGQEAIYLKNGGSVELVARSKNSGRGFTVDVLVMDEAQEMCEEDLEALMPTTSASPKGDPQWIFTGTPPGPTANGEIFTRVRAEALDGHSSRLSWHEWSAEPGCDLDDRELWREVNPALITGRLQFDVIEGERARFSDEGFARERLGTWASVSGGGVIPMQAWDVTGDVLSIPVERFALGVEVGPDSSWASVSLAGLRPDGRWHIELDESHKGSSWVVPYVKALIERNPEIRAVIADEGSPTKTLWDEFAQAKVRLTAPTVRDLGAAHMRMLEGIITGSIVHTDQPQMTAAASIATKRNLGDTGMWVFHRASSVSDITPIQSATLALWGAQNTTVKRPNRSTDNRRVVVL